MLSRNKKLFLFAFLLMFAFVLVGCGAESTMKKAAKAFDIPTETAEGFLLPTPSNKEITVTWESNSEALKIADGYAEVDAVDADVEVVLTATLSYQDATYTATFNVKVLKSIDPESIAIDLSKFTLVNGVYYMILDKKIDLGVDVNPLEASSTVTWTSSKTSVISIDASGKASAVGYGETVITAKSSRYASDNTLISSVKVVVVDSTTPTIGLFNAKKSIEDQVKEHGYVTESFKLPKPANTAVQVTYYDSNGDELIDDEYVYSYSIDILDKVTANLTYMGETNFFDITLEIVEDAEINDFSAMKAAKALIEEELKAYLVDKDLIKGNIVLPTSYTEDEVGQDVTIVWSTTSSYAPKPVSSAGVYTRPNDQSPVTISFYMECGDNDMAANYHVYAAGYTKEEIVEYIKENSMPKPNGEGIYEVTGANLVLATKDMTNKFSAANLEIVWESSNTDVLSNTGKFVNVFLATSEQVKMTATIKYYGTLEATFAFTSTLEYEFTVNPTANKAQSVALELGNYLSTDEFMSTVAHFPFGSVDQATKVERVGGNTMPLPKTIGEALGQSNEYKDIVISWSCPEETDLFDSNMKLLKQYLRYHEVALTYAITVDGNTATNEINVNVGIAEMKNTIYIGGWFNIDQTGGGNNIGDVLSALSKFDASVGTVATRSKAWGTTSYNDARGAWSGHTYYVDETNAETGVVTRYQFYTQGGTYMKLTESTTDAGWAEVNTENLKTVVATYGGNWGGFFHNTTDKALKVPMSPYDGGPVNPVTGEKWVANSKYARENGYSFDGYRVGWASDAEGNVVFGNGTTVIQGICQDYYVEIPAGGYGMTYKTMYNNATVVGRFCTVGLDLNVTYFIPYHYHAEGTPVDSTVTH